MWCETMTSAERMGAVIGGQRPDRVPVIPFISGHTALVCGQPISKFYEDAETCFRCQVLSQEMYGYDGDPLYVYASAGGWEFGGDIEFPYKKYSGAPVVTRHPVQSEEDALKLELPAEIAKAGALPIALELARMQAEHGMPVSLQVGSPFTFAGTVMGEDRMMTWMIKKPDLVHRVLDKVSDFGIAVAEHYVKEFGAEKLMAFHGAATESNKLISPKQFEQFVLPYYTKINKRVIELGIPSCSSTSAGNRTRICPIGNVCRCLPTPSSVSAARCRWQKRWSSSRTRSSPGMSSPRSSRKVRPSRCWSRPGSASRSASFIRVGTCSCRAATFPLRRLRSTCSSW